MGTSISKQDSTDGLSVIVIFTDELALAAQGEREKAEKAEIKAAVHEAKLVIQVRREDFPAHRAERVRSVIEQARCCMRVSQSNSEYLLRLAADEHVKTCRRVAIFYVHRRCGANLAVRHKWLDTRDVTVPDDDTVAAISMGSFSSMSWERDAPYVDMKALEEEEQGDTAVDPARKPPVIPR